MNTLKKIRWPLETCGVRIGLCVLPVLPRAILLALAHLAGTAAYYLAPSQRRVTLANLEIAFGARRSLREKRRLARQAFQNIARVLCDFFWFTRRTRERIERWVTVDPQVDVWVRAATRIGITAHFGNWELMSRVQAAHGHEHTAVAAPLENPAVDALFNRARYAGGTEIIPQKGALRGLLKALKHHRHIALLLDQNTKPEDGGLFVKIFGLPTPMSGAAAMLAERTGVAILVLFCRARPDGAYHLYARPPLIPAEAATPATTLALTQAIAAAFQEEIEKYPEQWLWMYKRWKYIAPGYPRAAYPFYAKALKPDSGDRSRIDNIEPRETRGKHLSRLWRDPTPNIEC